MLDPFTLPYVQRGLLEVLILAVGAGVLGTFIVLRGLAFFTHAVSAATFPGLVLADGLGFATGLGAFGTAALLALALATLAEGEREGRDALTALLLVAALAAGIVLASDVFHSAASVDSRLFGSLLLIGDGDVRLAGVMAALVVLLAMLLGPRWVALGFDREAARAAGVRSRLPDLVLLALIALAAVACVSATGALLASALLVVPAATARLWTRRLGAWQLASVALAAAEGVAGLWLSVKTNAPPGATVAVLAGVVFAVAAVGGVVRRRVVVR